MIKRRTYELFLLASTEYAEVLLGFLSLSMGIWLLIPSVHTIFQPVIINCFGPEIAGFALVIAGFLKLAGIYLQKIKYRIVSCFLACVMWLFLSIAFAQDQVARLNLVAIPLTLVMSVFNALIFIKLKVISK